MHSTSLINQIQIANYHVKYVGGMKLLHKYVDYKRPQILKVACFMIFMHMNLYVY